MPNSQQIGYQDGRGVKIGLLRNDLGQVCRKTFTVPAGKPEIAPQADVEYAFDLDGNLTSISSDGKTATYGYDAAGRRMTGMIACS